MSWFFGLSAYMEVCWTEVENAEFVGGEIQDYFNHWAVQCIWNYGLHQSPMKKGYLYVISESETGK